MNRLFDRRDLVRAGGMILFSGSLAALTRAILGCGSAAGTSSGSGNSGGDSATSSCLEATDVTRGPYFVDDRSDPNITNDVVDKSIPERSDIRPDSKGGTGTQDGLPLKLVIQVGAYNSSSGSCATISGAQVHVWHCNSQGIYSDVEASSNGSGVDYSNADFLRGYQFTDADGRATFTTVYPGWYSGRTVHIHVKVRIFDSSGNVASEATTQLFFDDATTTAVYAANAQYTRARTRDTLNTSDGIYNSEDPALLVSLTGSTTEGYTGTVSIGIIEGSIYGG